MSICEKGTFLNAAIANIKPLITYKYKSKWQNNDDTIHGVLGYAINDIVNSCCNTNATVNISRVEKYQNQLIQRLGDNEHIVAPYTAFPSFHHEPSNSSFLPVLGSPGAVFLVDIVKEAALCHITQILAVTWQLLVILLVSCCLSGVIIWLLDTCKNPDTFPRNFSSGCWEGIWWAFISMTTVGYGDLTPKSPVGRLFAMLWILVGICIFSVFTAALTASLTSMDDNRATLHGRKVGVLKGSDEYRLAALLGAKPFVFSSVGEMMKAIKDPDHEDEFEGILIDNAYVTQELMKFPGLKVLIQLDSPKVHGILFQNIDAGLIECFHRAGFKRQYDRSILRPYVVEKPRMFQRIVASETMSSWLYVSDIYIGIYASIVIAICLSLLTWEFVYWRPKHKALIGNGNITRKSAFQQSKEPIRCRSCKQVVETIS